MVKNSKKKKKIQPLEQTQVKNKHPNKSGLKFQTVKKNKDKKKTTLSKTQKA